MPDWASALAPACDGAVGEGHALGPPAALVDAGQALEQPGAQTEPLVGGASCSSSSADVTTTGASIATTDSTDVLEWRKVELPSIDSSLGNRESVA